MEIVGHDEDAVPATAILRRLRRRRRVTLSGAAGDPFLLVSDVGRPTRGTRPRQPPDRRAAGRDQAPGDPAPCQRLLAPRPCYFGTPLSLLCQGPRALKS